ncbi:UNVERIFIED_CONTAM: hypothetical protein GTU68_043286 [Idotea baltica]|nr:hypothetical protein [Idotea baltica]
MVGSAIWRNLESKGYTNLIGRSSSELNLINQNTVEEFFKTEKPDYVILAAAKVGGIVANNKYRAEFIYDNICIQNNVIHNSYKFNVKKLLFLGSSCIYPKSAPQPLKEEYLLTSDLEYTNEPYAIAKIAGIKMCEAYNIQYGTNFLSVMPTNLYGPNDNYDLEKSHVLPALIRKMYLGKYNNEVSIMLWGSGTPRREFLHADDMASGCVHIMENNLKNTHINIGCGKDLSIMELSDVIKNEIGFSGNIKWDINKPDGTFQKLLDVSKINKLGWSQSVPLKQGISDVCNNYMLYN